MDPILHLLAIGSSRVADLFSLIPCPNFFSSGDTRMFQSTIWGTQGLLGLFALTCFALLPGVAWIRPSGLTPLVWLARVSAVSIAMNSLALMMFTMVGVYTRKVALAWCFVLISVAVASWCMKRTTPNVSAESPRGLYSSTGGLFLLPILAVVGYKSLFLPVFTWDAVASWNQWARNFALVREYFYTETFFYPLYMSWGMSFPYVVSGNPEVDYFSHALSFAHVLVLFAGVDLISRKLEVPAWLPFCIMFVALPIAAFSGTGYADIPSTAYALVALGLYLHAVEIKGRWRAIVTSGLAGFSAATSFLFKQTALPVLVVIPVLYMIVVHPKPRVERIKLGLAMAVGFNLVTLPWVISGQTTLTGDQFEHVTFGIHGGIPQWQIIQKGVSNFFSSVTSIHSQIADGSALLLLIILTVLAATKNQKSRLLTLAMLIHLSIWVNTANYDTRGGMVAFALFSLVAAQGLLSFLDPVWQRFGHYLIPSVAALLLGIFLLTEFSGLAWSETDWRQDRNWYKTSPFSSREEKLTTLIGGYGDFAKWKKQNFAFSATLWTDSVFAACFRPRQPFGGARWYGRLAYHGIWHGKAGDVLLMKTSDLEGQVPGVFGYSQPMTWGEWVEIRKSQQCLADLKPIGDLQIYQILECSQDGRTSKNL